MKKFTQVLLVVFLISIAGGVTSASGQFFFMENENVGKAVPDFTLKTASGEEVNLAKYRDGKKAIVFFWATWCPHCRAALKELTEKKDELEKSEIKLVLVDLGEDPDLVKGYIEKNSVPFIVFLDERNELAEPYGIVGVPTFFFVNKNGIVKDVGHSLPDNYDVILSKD